MPVITPAYPEHNAAFTVIHSTKLVLQQHWQSGLEIMDMISQGKYSWSDLFSSKNFFKSYRHFLMVTAKSGSNQDHLDWSGFVEAKLRSLFLSLETLPVIELLHPYPRAFTPLTTKAGAFGKAWLIGLTLRRTEGQNSLDITSEVRQFNAKLCETATERGLYRKGMTLEIKHVKRKQLEQQVPPQILEAAEI